MTEDHNSHLKPAEMPNIVCQFCIIDLLTLAVKCWQKTLSMSANSKWHFCALEGHHRKQTAFVGLFQTKERNVIPSLRFSQKSSIRCIVCKCFACIDTWINILIFGQNVQYITRAHCVQYYFPQCNMLNITFQFQCDKLPGSDSSIFFLHIIWLDCQKQGLFFFFLHKIGLEKQQQHNNNNNTTTTTTTTEASSNLIKSCEYNILLY